MKLLSVGLAVVFVFVLTVLGAAGTPAPVASPPTDPADRDADNELAFSVTLTKRFFESKRFLPVMKKFANAVKFKNIEGSLAGFWNYRLFNIMLRDVEFDESRTKVTLQDGYADGNVFFSGTLSANYEVIPFYTSIAPGSMTGTMAARIQNAAVDCRVFFSNDKGNLVATVTSAVGDIGEVKVYTDDRKWNLSQAAAKLVSKTALSPLVRNTVPRVIGEAMRTQLMQAFTPAGEQPNGLGFMLTTDPEITQQRMHFDLDFAGDNIECTSRP